MTENVIEFAKRGAPAASDDAETMHGDGDDGGASSAPVIEVAIYDDGEVYLSIQSGICDAAFERAIDAVRGFRQDWRGSAMIGGIG